MTKLNQKALNVFRKVVQGLLDNPQGSQNNKDGENLLYYVLSPIMHSGKPNFGALETGVRDFVPMNFYKVYNPELIA